jgi:hypothetical protein
MLEKVALVRLQVTKTPAPWPANLAVQPFPSGCRGALPRHPREDEPIVVMFGLLTLIGATWQLLSADEKTQPENLILIAGKSVGEPR